MQRPKRYTVFSGMTTPDEPHEGIYFSTEDESGDSVIHGPYSSRMDAEEAIDEIMFNAGEVGA